MDEGGASAPGHQRGPGNGERKARESVDRADRIDFEARADLGQTVNYESKGTRRIR
jgi:hypothetical protein